MATVPQSTSQLSMQVCPRCTGPIEIRGTTTFASMSRATPDRDIEICAPCGSDEALRASATGRLIPVAAWPIVDAHEFHRPVQDAINVFLTQNGVAL